MPAGLTLDQTGKISGTPSVSGDFPITVKVQDVVGVAATQAYMLTITPAIPVITTQPADQIVTAGDTASFSVVAAGTPPLSYQWKRDGTAISGATSSSYTTAATVAADSGARFTVTASNAAGSVTSNAAILTVNVPPAITTQPTNQIANVGDTATLSVVATGTAPPQLSVEQERHCD